MIVPDENGLYFFFYLKCFTSLSDSEAISCWPKTQI